MTRHPSGEDPRTQRDGEGSDPETPERPGQPSGTGVVFPAVDGSRSTSATGREVVADALSAVDPIGSRAASAETNWRSGYLAHFRRLVEAGVLTPDSARTIASDGLASLHSRLRFVEPAEDDAEGRPLLDAITEGRSSGGLSTETVHGTGQAERQLSVPYAGDRLTGDGLHRRLDAWVEEGTIEPSCAEAVRLVMANPEWLDLSDQRLVVLGAGSEMGPLQSVLRWGGEVVAVDLPRPSLWRRVLATAETHAGTLHVPVRGAPGGPTTSSGAGDDRSSRTGLAARAGADLLHDLPDVTRWIDSFEGRLVLGNYVYADGATNVRVSMAVDAMSAYLCGTRSDTALAFLATPTDVFAVPGEAVDASTAAYESARASKLIRRPLRALSGGRLLRRNYAPGSDPGICDSLVAQQGPNYVLAKRLQRWRATVARREGHLVSLKVAPPTRTRSVLRNRALAAAYAGAHRFGVRVFDPATSNTLMAALLVHDLRTSRPPATHPWQDEAFAAAHGGLWRGPYDPRSALGLAVLLGIGSAR